MEIRKLKEEKLFQIGTVGNGYSLKLEPSKAEFHVGFMNKAKYVELTLTRKMLLDIIEAFNAIEKTIVKEIHANEVDGSNAKGF